MSSPTRPNLLPILTLTADELTFFEQLRRRWHPKRKRRRSEPEYQPGLDMPNENARSLDEARRHINYFTDIITIDKEYINSHFVQHLQEYLSSKV